MNKLILEIFSEEIPAKLQKYAIKKLDELLIEVIPNSNITPLISPRHIIFSIDNFQLENTKNIKGPKTSATKDQLKGFLSKYKIESLEELTVENNIYYFKKHLTDEETLCELSNNISIALNKMVWPKSMLWNSYNLKWIRPIHSIACLLNDKILPVTFGHIKSSNKTYGHRSQGSREIELQSSDLNNYLEQLKQGGVIASQEERKSTILNQISNIIEPLKLTLISDSELLDEVVGLVENPNVFLGKIDQQFMSLPGELLVTSLKNNQKYLLLNDLQGQLAPYFIIVSDIKPSDGGNSIIAGNERVVRARLSDAQHFIKSDLQIPFGSLMSKLHKIQFHKDIGSLYAKVERITKIAEKITSDIAIDPTDTVRAAELCKNDLVTNAVGEFPELQGIIGYYYCKAHGENENVAKAIRDHYKPYGPNDSIPETIEGSIVAIADKLDTLNSLFAVGIKPTSTKDPYALRRAALGIIRIISHNDLLLNKIKLDVSSDVMEFIIDRAKNFCKGKELDRIMTVLSSS
jgi:glycyl-tRNA synthetase beta chain